MAQAANPLHVFQVNRVHRSLAITRSNSYPPPLELRSTWRRRPESWHTTLDLPPIWSTPERLIRRTCASSRLSDREETRPRLLVVPSCRLLQPLKPSPNRA